MMKNGVFSMLRLLTQKKFLALLVIHLCLTISLPDYSIQGDEDLLK